MKPCFSVNVDSFSIVQEIEGAWSSDDYKQMLEEMEYGDPSALTDAELLEMCLLSLQ